MSLSFIHAPSSHRIQFLAIRRASCRSRHLLWWFKGFRPQVKLDDVDIIVVVIVVEMILKINILHIK